MMDTQDVETYDIFISHSYDDYEKVSSYLYYLKDELHGFGKFFPVFIAHEDIMPSKKWQDEIVRVIKRTKIFIAYLTPNFKESKWCDQESGFACATDQLIISLMDGAKPYGFLEQYEGMRMPPELKYGYNSNLQKFAISIVKLIYKDERYKGMVRERIFEHLMDISTFDQANLVFSLLKYWKPFTEEEKSSILKAYKENNQINQAGLAISFIEKLEHDY